MVTLKDLESLTDELKERFGSQDVVIAYANVSQTQLSVARYWGRLRIHDKPFTYNPEDDSLIRDDVIKFVRKLQTKKKPRKKAAVQRELPMEEE